MNLLLRQKHKICGTFLKPSTQRSRGNVPLSQSNESSDFMGF